MSRRLPVSAPNRFLKAVARQVPAPVDGVNANTALDGMKDTEAVFLENFFPAGNWVESRLGTESFKDTGTATFVPTLMTLKIGVISKFLAASNGEIFDITSTSTSIASGFSEDRWQWTQFNKRTFFVNGTDAPQSYDGTTVSATAWTGIGLTISDLINVDVFKNRIFFVEKNSQSFWYGNIHAITGTLREFNLAEVGDFEGNLVSVTSITQDGGDGVDDLFVALFSEGDVVVYNGTDPGSNFFQIGTFKIGRPIGQRPERRVGSDVAVITEDGYILLTEVLPFGRLRPEKAFSDSYREVVIRAINDFKTNDGWEMIHYPPGNKLIVNVPQSATTSVQHVVNTSSAAWCTFKSINSVTWGIFEGDIYFGTADGKILKAETGFSDNGVEIVASGQSAWNYFSNKTNIKRFNDCRPLFQLQTDTTSDISLLTDFDTNLAFSPMLLDVTEETGAVWDTGVWDVAIWGGALTTAQDWNTVSGVGYAASLAFRVSSSTQQFRWISTTFTMERGGLI